ncbi:MAG: hypothetical protein SGI74_12410 [Oligoflexia bacterium]|nr:hypothetical protein [Oligoflexia bacterium]
MKRYVREPSLGTITIIESHQLSFKLGAELAQILGRKYIDCQNQKLKQNLLDWLPWRWHPRVISREPEYSPGHSDGRVIRADIVLGRNSQYQKAEVLRRAMIMLERGE